jgi:fibronectin type 3 domain-containing protein
VLDLAGYRIYRSSARENGPFDLLGETPAPPYRDTHFEFGQTYYYQVSAFFGASSHASMSEASPPVKVVARDIFPPAAPQGLEGLYSAGAVELVWTANTESDLAGYNVYRLDGQPAQRLNKELVPTPEFRDSSVAAARIYLYYVTAVDQSGNESKPSQKAEIETK